MGIWDRLFGGRFTMPPPETTELSDSECFKALRPELPEQRRALKSLLELLLVRLPAEERGRLERRILRKLKEGECPETALYEGLIDDRRGQKLEQLTLMVCDYRGFDSFEYLAPILVRASGISAPFAYAHDGSKALPEVLAEFDVWLQKHGMRYLHMDTGGDECAGFVVEAQHVQPIMVLAKEADIGLSLENF